MKTIPEYAKRPFRYAVRNMAKIGQTYLSDVLGLLGHLYENIPKRIAGKLWGIILLHLGPIFFDMLMGETET